MSTTPNPPARTTDIETEWPRFELEFTFNPKLAGREFDPDEVVVYDRRVGVSATRWIAAERGSYVAVDEVR
ncbi:hypothetical protein [Halegenticoccus tardaugens]|uniref:hypothetical protein n=1 Tax=Halegenticoccus tardaugens TaxID=2071624 RepID=UPI00100BFEED|nr:hypothetical protein [Halegenticoccus tardaugens]